MSTNESKDYVKNFALFRMEPSQHAYVEPGLVAVGTIFKPSNKVVMQWVQKNINSINIYDNIDDLLKITCSHSQSRIEYI